MAKRKISYYQEAIMSDTGCPKEVVHLVEEIMRTGVLHSTLDWLPPEEFRETAILAFEVFEILKKDPEWCGYKGLRVS